MFFFKLINKKDIKKLVDQIFQEQMNTAEAMALVLNREGHIDKLNKRIAELEAKERKLWNLVDFWVDYDDRRQIYKDMDKVMEKS